MFISNTQSMKKILFIICMFIFPLILFSQKQVHQTRWKGQVLEPQAIDIVLNFRNDSLVATSADGRELGVMFFLQYGDTLMIRKLSEQGPCNNETEGVYRVELTENGDKLTLYIITDRCRDRARSITSTVYSRMRD